MRVLTAEVDFRETIMHPRAEGGCTADRTAVNKDHMFSVISRPASESWLNASTRVIKASVLCTR